MAMDHAALGALIVSVVTAVAFLIEKVLKAGKHTKIKSPCLSVSVDRSSRESTPPGSTSNPTFEREVAKAIARMSETTHAEPQSSAPTESRV